MSTPSPEMRALVSANVRKAMILQDVTSYHIAQVLEMTQAGASHKLNNRDGNHFSEEQIEKLAAFFAIPVETLTSPDMSEEAVVASKHTAPKFNKSEKDPLPDEPFDKTIRSDIPIPRDVKEPKVSPPNFPKDQELPDEGENDIIQELIDHIDLGGENSEAYELKTKIYQATLTGRIPNIVPFLGNSLVATALRTYRKRRRISTPIDITEEQQTRFIDYYKEQYEDWKRMLWPDAEKAIELILVNNKLNSVMNLVRVAVRMPLTSVSDMVDQCLTGSDDRIDVQRLSDLFNMMIEDLMHVKKPLDDYLYEKINVSGA